MAMRARTMERERAIMAEAKVNSVEKAKAVIAGADAIEAINQTWALTKCRRKSSTALGT